MENEHSKGKEKEEAPDKQIHLNKIDIFQNLKISMQKAEKNCQCDNRKAYYCFPCKQSICPSCGYNEHIKHILLEKSNYVLSSQYINEVFNTLTTEISKGNLFCNYKNIQSTLIQNIETMTSTLHEKINQLKGARIEEVIKMFSNFDTAFSSLRTNIDISEKTLKRYVESTASFFNLKNDKIENDDYNNDEMNTMFLMNLDIISLCNEDKKTLIGLMKNLNEDIEAYKERQLKQIKSHLETLDKWLVDAYSDAKYPKTTRNLSLPNQNFESDTINLGDNFFSNARSRANKYESFITSFKKTVHDTLKLSGVKDIEKFVSNYENSKKKESDSLFSQRKPVIYSTFAKSTRGYHHPRFNSPDEVILNNSLLEKYFSFQILEIYKKNFRMQTKELQSSHADLIVKPNANFEEKDIPDIGKAIEGTNEVIFYDKKKGTITKKSLKLTKNPFGYSWFPIGCRSCLLGDKIFITGGIDEIREYKNVIIYDRKTENLKRIMDLKYGRSYHTMIYSDFFATIMVIGGQNCNKVEIFDPSTNRWHELPPLQIPRANSIFYFDKPRGVLYTMFGVISNILKGVYTDSIECLDLANIKQGWKKVAYKNKAEVSVRTYLNALPISGDKLILAGTFTLRSNERVMVVFDLLKKEIRKVDQKLIEELRGNLSLSKKINNMLSGYN